MIRRILPLVAACALAACGTDSASEDADVTTLDTGADAGDTSIDVSDDVVPDADEEDAGDDTDEDVAPDADPDTSPDVTPDATTDVAPDTDVEIPPRCEENSDCNDGLTCTADTCNEGVCEWTVRDNRCLVNGRCVEAGAASPADPCSVCDPEQSALAWSPAGEGDRCDDGNVCTIDTTCQAGACVGSPIACDDRNACTTDSCDPVGGCQFDAVDDGATCDDGDLCTEADRCVAGECAGDSLDCDDGNPCTADACGEDGSCTNEILDGAACNDGDACTINDMCNADGTCGGEARTCDDGNECTIDICDEFAGCVYVPNLNPCCTGTVSICDDGDPCTTDLCDPGTGACDYESNSAVCDDGDACTANDQCSEGVCGGDAVDCPTTGPCQAAFCDSEDGCGVELLDGVGCSDGVECTVNDMCVAGVCVGTSECVCEPDFGLDATVVTAVEIGSTPTVRPEFCDRVSSCDAGVDNALNFVAGFANEPLAEAVADGSLTLLLDLDDVSLNPFELELNTGERAPGSEECDPSAAVCSYEIAGSSLDPDTCEGFVSLSLTRAGNGVFLAGPPAVFPFDVPLGDSTLSLTVYEARFFGELSFDGDRVAGLEGLIAGAVRKTDLIAAVEALPEDSLPLPPAQIANLINTLVTNDVDTDGDGNADAASIALVLSATQAEITGVAP